MTQQPIVHQPTGRLLKTGRTRPDPALALKRRKFKAVRYIRRAAPRPPESMAASPLAQPCLDRMLLNDTLSDCTAVTSLKCSALVLGSAGVPIIYSNQQAADLYRGSTGWNGTPATDQGGNEDDVIDYVVKHGTEKNLHHWAGKLSVDASNPDEVRYVMNLCRHLYCGAELARTWTQVPNGAVLSLDGGPDPDMGHAFTGKDYDPDGVTMNFWGGIEVKMPWALLPQFCLNTVGGELHAMISRDMIQRGKMTTASGFNWEELEEDFRVHGGSLAA